MSVKWALRLNFRNVPLFPARFPTLPTGGDPNNAGIMGTENIPREKVERFGGKMRFTKMHGIGNDYVYLDCFAQPAPADPAALSQKMSDRHCGVGGDGLVLMLPPDDPGADARMRMFNADGSEAQMCGNAIRCVAKYLFDHRVITQEVMTIQTGRGPLRVELEVVGGVTRRVRVNMAPPILESARIPTTIHGDPPRDASIQMDGRTLQITAVSMGNPHAVIFLDHEPNDDWVLGVGPRIEKSAYFPQRVNVEFVQVLSTYEFVMRVWERGSGETWACGTGACAVCVAGVLTGRMGRKVVGHLRGGDLELHWSESDNCVYMTGPATEVFQGEWLGDTR